jgi:hypothetical protein
MNQTKQIIPDSQSVARCLDPRAIESLGLHSTFTLEELLEKTSQPFEDVSESFLSARKAASLIHQVRNISNYGPPDFYRDINDIVHSSGKLISEGKTATVFREIRTNANYFPKDLCADINGNALSEKHMQASLINILVEGANILLLSPEGKGWQKGKLKICFEFIPEETVPKTVSNQTGSIESTQSPLDEIRNLTIE